MKTKKVSKSKGIAKSMVMIPLYKTRVVKSKKVYSRKGGNNKVY